MKLIILILLGVIGYVQGLNLKFTDLNNIQDNFEEIKKKNNSSFKLKGMYEEPVTTQPVIGILMYPSTYSIYPEDKYSFIPASYVKYLEMAGARVVPVYYDAPKEYYDKILSKLNGMLFTGGGQDFSSETVLGKNGHYIFQKIKDINDSGVYFPLWGTCLGYEMIMTFAVDWGLDLGHVKGQQNVTTKIEILKDTNSMFEYMPEQIKNNVQNEYLSYENHVKCVYEDYFYKNTKLDKFFNLLAVSEDDDGKSFVTSVEAKNYPIFGVQFHPEKNSFEWKVYANHTLQAVQMEQFYANFFVQQARYNDQAFEEGELDKVVIYNFDPVYSTFSSSYDQVYFFENYKQQDSKSTEKLTEIGDEVSLFKYIFQQIQNTLELL